MDAAESAAPIERLAGVYDANGSLAGELAYWFGVRIGVRHCALGDITHGTFRAKPEWQRRVSQLPVEFSAVHLNEREPMVVQASAGREPCVVAMRADGSAEVVIGPGELESCDGDPERLSEMLLELFGPPEPGTS